MSNKETLQGYNERLSTNNLTLDSILNTVNNLPDKCEEPVLQEKTIEINDEYMIDIIPDEGFYGLSKVSIKVNPNG